jgi:hypothetical protein
MLDKMMLDKTMLDKTTLDGPAWYQFFAHWALVVYFGNFLNYKSNLHIWGAFSTVKDMH